MLTRPGSRIMMLTALLALLAMMVSTVAAYAQWPGARTGGTAVSYSYSGGENGVRLELSRDRMVYDVGYFDADDEGNIYVFELGLRASDDIEDYGGVPFVFGAGAYHYDPPADGAEAETDFNVWAGVGDFDHSRKGLFYQYRYNFGGPLHGSEGIIGWAF